VPQFQDSEILQIAAGENHNLLLTRNSNLYAWGSNDVGQCSQIPSQLEKVHTPFEIVRPLKDEVDEIASIACGPDFSGLLTRSGAVYTFGANHLG
jgi:alpha-tubulin suppressor-like RCC1 family protein